MSSKQTRCSSYLIGILLVVSVIVEGSPVETTPKTASTTADAAAVKLKDSTVIKGTEATNQQETTTPRGETNKIETTHTTYKTDPLATLKPGTSTTPKQREGLKGRNDKTTRRHPTSLDEIPFKPSPQIFGNLTLNSTVKQTTRTPTTTFNTSAPKDKHVKAPPKSIKKSSPIRITRIYRVKSQKDCSSKKEHDVKVHVGEGRYLNIKITED